ncbi:PIN/TRAM domain-containing protein [Haloferula helveola]|uniref:PIN/TRAM domain-containing protein n=1 Tax=Haloferula helveola TaxID=490095 RepID=A0ABN6H2I4_9BACT|nr:PIN/TRAM domain-containing protein [Haloferula helveola]
MSTPASVNIARLVYLLVCEAAGLVLAFSTRGNPGWEIPMWAGLLGGLLIAGFFIFVETLIKGFTLRGFSTATFGLLVGLFCAFLLTRVGFSDVLASALNRNFEMDSGAIVSGPDVAVTISLAVSSLLYASLGFLGAVLALRSSRDDFAFILPYVRFRQDGSTGQPVVLDGESIMDGRVPGVVRAGFLTVRLIVPRFVLDELQVLAESPSQANRQRAQRGLDLLEKMQESKDILVSIEDASGVSGDETMHGRLLQTAQLLGARLMTTDDSLSKVAKLRSVDVLNLNDLQDALRPTVVVGDKIRLPLVRGGKDEHQGVGYLTDGTMIVVNHAVDRIGSTCDVRVISTLQTANGVMIFAELDE